MARAPSSQFLSSFRVLTIISTILSYISLSCAIMLGTYSDSFRIIAGAAADARGDLFSPVLLEYKKGSVVMIRKADSEDKADFYEPNLLITPPLVNSHVHLDLSDGKINSNQCSFPKFISSVVSHRRSQQMVLGAVHDAVLTGIDACLNGGVALVGNISSVNVSETRALLQSSFLGGVNYEEVISYSSKDFSGNTALAYSVDGFLHGWSPHAPYTVSIEDLELLSKLGRPLAIHLAETKEEVEALQQWSGPLADVVRSISGKEILWKSDKHPVEVIASKFFGLNALAVHLNHLPEELDELIIQSGLLPVYCPRASFFLKQSSKLEHPCIRLHKKGLPVALGSDSSMVLNDSQGLSTIGDARFLVTRGHVSAAVAFEMASVAGARALGFDEEFFYLKEGPLAGLLGWNIDICSSKSPLEQLMGGDQSPRWLAGPSLGTL